MTHRMASLTTDNAAGMEAPRQEARFHPAKREDTQPGGNGRMQRKEVAEIPFIPDRSKTGDCT
jgi:hypothetical protein